ncbi:TRAP transporter substrate-binding protein [Reyranella sp.]|uniref:TRAP transporter substrate-binding protein n=1 Tax=Reyranella sp. TaxID=1929291 RepID=UPI002F939BEE
MRRRTMLAGAAITSAAVAGGVSGPALSQGIRQLKMVTSWPADLPGLQTSATRLARTIDEATGGRLRIEIFPADALVRPLEVFDAVSAGVADMYHSAENYFETKSFGFNFFAAIPFGFTADELFAWVQYGGGQELWDDLSGRFNVKPLLCLNSGCQMGGWFVREMVSVESFKGLRYRMPGPGGEVLRRLGAIVVLLPGGEIVPALKSGAIDASEWIGPWLDMAIGLHQAVPYYCYPGFHEPGTGFSLGINRGVWDSLAVSDRRIIEAVAAAEYARSLAEFNANNAAALVRLRKDSAVRIVKFDDTLLKELHRLSRDVVAEAGASDDISKKIYASYQAFRGPVVAWSDIGEHAYLNARSLS